jgi:hypothetical protein
MFWGKTQTDILSQLKEIVKTWQILTPSKIVKISFYLLDFFVLQVNDFS